jgi:hypothetical protein
MHVVCLLFGHRRSKRKVRHHFLGDKYLGYKSSCRWCGTPLVRIEHGRWTPVTNPDQPAAANWPFSETG